MQSNPRSPTSLCLARALATLVLVLSLAACSPGPEENAHSAETPEIAADGQAVLRKGNGAEPQTLDPHKAQGVPAANILRDLYEGLVSEAPDGSLAPGVAERWEIGSDGRVYTFYLRDNARWSDGTPLTAEDFVYSLRRSVDPATGSAYAQILAPIRNAKAIIRGERPPEALGVAAPDKHRLRIELNAPTPYFLGLLTHASAYPVHRATVKAHGNRFTQPGNNVSNGAYVIADWVVGSHIALQRDPEYWDAADTSIDTVRYLAIDNADSELKRYRAGELDWTSSVPLGRIEWARERLPQQFRVTPYFGTYYYGLNLARPPFEDNRALRKALSLAIDRQRLVDKVTRGGERPAYGWVPPGLQDYTGQRLAYADWPRAKQIKAAKRAYREAGYSEDHPLDVEIRYNTSEAHKKIAVAVASMWKTNLGVETRLINEEWKVFLQNVRLKEVTEVYRAAWIGDYADAYTFLELLRSDFGLNGTGFDNAEYDRLLEAAAGERDPERRRVLMQRAERLLLDQHAIVPLYFYVSKHLLKPYIRGYQPNIMDHHYTKDLAIEVGQEKTAPAANE